MLSNHGVSLLGVIIVLILSQTHLRVFAACAHVPGFPLDREGFHFPLRLSLSYTPAASPEI